MSMFLPDGASQSQPQSGVASFTPADPETTAADVALMQRVLSAASRNVNLIPSDFMAYIVDYIQTARLTIPIGQVFGFSQFTVQAAVQSSDVTTALTTPSDLGGPTITGISDGKYLMIFGAIMDSTAASSGADSSNMKIVDQNGAAGDNGVFAATQANFLTSCAAADTITLSGGSANKLSARYWSGSGATAQWFNRFLVALKYANI